MTDTRETVEPSRDAKAHCIMQLSKVRVLPYEEGKKNYFRVGEVLALVDESKASVECPLEFKVKEINENGDIIDLEIVNRGEYDGEIFEQADLQYKDMNSWLDIDSNFGLVSDLRIDREEEGTRRITVKDYSGNYKELASQDDLETNWFDINKIWNWEKNNELGINPYEITYGSTKYIWVYCLDNDYHNYDIYNNKIGYKTTCNSFSCGRRCPYCCNFHGRVHYKDSLAYKYPNVAKMISIPENNLTFEDCYNISPKGNSIKYYFKCSNCNELSDKKLALNHITDKGIYLCKRCSDGISIPNKFMYNILYQLNLNFKREYSPYYFRNHQSVDFLLIDYNIIIEMDGSYGNHTREYDYWRDFLNMKYGGYKTIRIDLTNNKEYNRNIFNYIKKQIINSELSKLFDLNDIDWNFAWVKSQNSKCVETLKLHKKGLSNSEISNVLDIDKSTVAKYIKRFD